MIAPRTRNGILVMGAIVAGLMWLSRGQQADDAGAQGDFNTRLNYAVQNFELTVLDVDGAPHLTVRAPGLEHEARTGIGTVADPQVTLREPDAEWQMTANSATIAADRDHVALRGSVAVRRDATALRPAFALDTESLDVAVSERFARTDDAVIIREGPNRLEAIGMSLDLVKETFELDRNVRGTYDMP